jgi:hypothetical protein
MSDEARPSKEVTEAKRAAAKEAKCVAKEEKEAKLIAKEAADDTKRVSDEAKKVSKLIQLNNQSTFVTKVTIKNTNEMMTCVKAIHESCPNTIVLITCAIVETNTLIAASAVPPKTPLYDFLPNAIVSVTGGQQLLMDETVPNLAVIEITYPEDSEQYAFKNVDIVNGTAFGILKKAGLYVEEEDSSECELPEL